ncbi:MAG TPA: radical SAM protein [Candidatus Hydrogenedens sp.]|nr:radical SAM protein [Candidatus Hydrogenedens sp.]HPP57504.1 radical SAM protein [Candidatus Hydrogenedens sp.]
MKLKDLFFNGFYSSVSKKKVKILYILPSHYDDDGYPFRFWKALLPSNTSTCMKALTEQIVEDGEIEGDYEISVEMRDDFVHEIDVQKIVYDCRRQKEDLIVGLVGVQSNMFSRATDLALMFRKYEVPVLIGGFHVSGVMKLFGKPTSDLQMLIDNGVSIVCGEVEGRGVLSRILNDAIRRRLKPYYIIHDSPDISSARVPVAEPGYLKHFMQPMCTIDTSRGCPFNCSFCTIINVQGRKIRCRSAQMILEAIEKNYDNGFYSYFFTDDNLSRSPVWRELFEGLIQLKQKGKKIRFMMQIDTQAWKIPDFVSLAGEAGCYLVFVGMESVNPDNLEAMKKTQNKTSEYVDMVEAWHKAGILVHVGYIIGMPFDTLKSVVRDVELLKNELRVDEASFFIMTPLPGSRDHKERFERGEHLEEDYNFYDSCHETFPHPNFKKGELKATWRKAWSLFYSKDNIIEILLRCSPEQYWNIFWLTLWNRYSTLLSNHPMSMGFIRRKLRRDRRPTMEKESHLVFIRRRVRDFVKQLKVIMQVFYEYQEIWLLTRKQLKEKRDCLASLYSSIKEIHTQILRILHTNQYAQFVSQEYENIFQKSNELILQLSHVSGRINRRIQKRLEKEMDEIREQLSNFKFRVPNMEDLTRFDSFIRKTITRKYEEMLVKSVARRRSINRWWVHFKNDLADGKFYFRKIFLLPEILVYELFIGLRFAISAVRMK